jgi:hypothetical protein
LAFQSLAQRLNPDALPPAWEDTVGLSALLEVAKALPARGPWDVEDLGEEPSGLAQLVKEAREREKQPGDGVC